MAKKPLLEVYPLVISGCWEKSDTCIVGISVGQHYHEGRRLTAILNFAASNFESVVILVADSLKRFTFSIKKGSVPEAYRADAVRLGDEWLSRNANKLAGIKVPYRVLRYSNWSCGAEFAERIQTIRTIYVNENLLENAVRTDSDDYLTKLSSRGWQSPLSQKKLYHACAEFLLEELAVCSLVSESVGSSTECYPGPMLNCFRLLTEDSFANIPLPLVNWCYIPLGFKPIVG